MSIRLLAILALFVVRLLASVTYTYDAAGHLIKADYGSAGVVVYTYDAAGNLISRQVQVGSTPVPAFITAYTSNSPRNDFSGWVGMTLTVGSSPLSVSSLGRICVASNAQTHTVKFVTASTGGDLAGASASVSMAGCTAGQFVYTTINPITLAAGTSYYLVSQETQGGDRWYDQGAVTPTTVATVNSAVYSLNGSWIPINSTNNSYVPPNFQYSVVIAMPSLTVQTNPSGRSFTVDGITYVSTQTFSWTSGSSHVIATTSPQGTTGTRYVWSNWSDGGAISHTVTPVSAVSYTANFTTQYLLSSSVSPAGSGTITTNPTSTDGYYNSGTSVQLTATPASGCTFVNWTGIVSSANPLTVTMSSPQTVTANFQCTTTTGTSFVTGYALSGQSLRSDFSGWVGMKVTVGTNPAPVSALGRICVANNAQTHTVKFVNAAGGSDVSGASASVNMAGCTAGQFVYTPISSVTLTAGTSYYLVSQETQGGDQWYDQGSISATTVATVNSAVYGYNGSWIPINSTNTSYVPPNFQYGGTPPTQYLLTTNVSPPGGGSISANPSSATGSYNSGTPVQLTAAPASNCTFINWTGTTSGSTNPLTVTMSSAQTVTANFQCSTSTGTSFVTGYALNNPTPRNDFSGWVGMKLTVGANALTVSALGRICMANNAQTHAVKFVNASSGSDVSGASASVNMAGCAAGSFVYASISSVTLTAGASYYLVSQETQGGDQWYDQGSISATNVATVNSAVYSYNGSWIPIGSANTSYVPPNFQYGGTPVTQYLLTTNVSPSGSGSLTANPTSPSGSYNSGTPVQLTATAASGCSFVNWTGTTSGSTNPLTVTMSSAQTVTANFQCTTATGTSFVTKYALNNPQPRNDFNGWVGMKLTVGANPLTVSALGRICLANNAQTHTVKFVNAIGGSDVSGASASVSMAGCTAGQFVFASISPITLAAGASYYLVSQETQGGDQWYDQGAISATSAATVNNSVYFYSGSWYPINSANTSYVPPNFQYQ